MFALDDLDNRPIQGLSEERVGYCGCPTPDVDPGLVLLVRDGLEESGETGSHLMLHGSLFSAELLGGVAHARGFIRLERRRGGDEVGVP